MSDRTGQLDRYQLICKLGSGAFGQVYQAKERYHHNNVAIKILPSLATEDLPRFLTEARIMMRLKHSHIVQILDFGIDIEKQTPFLVMEYAPNGTLRQRHPKGSCVPLPTILSYVTQLASALQVAHNDQVIHRDIKPENMLLNQRNQVLLSDFGIATMVPGSALHSAQTFGGTVPYMAPEQTEGHPCSASDQYSLAVVIYEWVCGQRPFHGSIFEIAVQHRLNPPPSLREQDPMISPQVEQVVFTALAKDPMKRFVSVKAFALALEAACSDAHLSVHVRSSILSPEAVPQVPLASDSKMQILGGMDNNASSISRDVVAATGVTADIIAPDLIEKEAQQSPMPTTPISQMSSPVSSAVSDITPPPPPDTADPAIGTGIDIIELLPSPQPIDRQPTAKLTDTAAATSAVQLPVTPIPRTPFQRHSTEKTVVVTGATATASVARGAGESRSTIRSSNLAQAETSHRNPRRGGLIAIILILAILLIGGGVVISAPGLLLFHSGLFAGGNTPPATITITPDSKVEQDSYVIQAVTSNADPSKRQVSLRQLTFSPPKQSKSVTATGVSHIAATSASGTLVFSNGSVKDYPLEAGTSIQNSNGVSVTTNQFVDIPAGNPVNNFVATASVPAHAANPGIAGNIEALSIDQFCCASGNAVGVKNPNAFSGGKDQKDYTFLQQSDVDSVVNQLKPTLSQQALNGFKGQIKSNEQLVSDPQCTTQPNVDQPVGDQGQNVTSANVTINATCTGLAYNASGAQTLAQNLLKSKAIGDLGQGYALVGTIITKQTVTDVKDSLVTLQVAVASTWYYQFDDQQKQALANQLVNKSRDAAQRLLNDYRGIAKASIDITTGDGNTLPRNPQQISIKVLAVSGASLTDLPALPSIEPTSPLAVSKGRG